MKKGFTLIELLIVMIVIALLAALLLPALVKAICAARETKCQDLIGNVEMACKTYEKDFNAYPADSGSGSSFDTGPCVYALSQPNAKKQPYIEFMATDVTAYPITQSSNLVNPAVYNTTIHYRNNANVAAGMRDPAAKNKYSVDLWAENCAVSPSKQTGINNWRASE